MPKRYKLHIGEYVPREGGGRDEAIRFNGEVDAFEAVGWLWVALLQITEADPQAAEHLRRMILTSGRSAPPA